MPFKFTLVKDSWSEVLKPFSQSLAAVGPMLNVIGLFSVIAGLIGQYILYAAILAFIITVLNIYMPYKVSKHLTTNGGYYTVAGIYLGKRAGVFTSLLYSIYGLLAFPSITLFQFTLLDFVFGISTALPLTILISIITVLIVIRGFNSTINYLKYLTLLEISFLIILDLIMSIEGQGAIPSIRSTPINSWGFWVAMLYSLLMFAGLGSSLFISENVNGSKKNVPKGILNAYLVSGFLMVFSAYSIIKFLGMNIYIYATNPYAILEIINRSFGSLAFYLVVFFSVLSSINLSLAYLNSWRNAIAKMGNDRILHKLRSRDTILSAFIISISILIISYIYNNGFTGFVIVTGLVSLFYLTVHIVSNVSYLKHVLGEKNNLGISIILASTIILLTTIILTIYGDFYSMIMVSYLYLTLITSALIAVMILVIRGNTDAIELHYY